MRLVKLTILIALPLIGACAGSGGSGTSDSSVWEDYGSSDTGADTTGATTSGVDDTYGGTGSLLADELGPGAGPGGATADRIIYFDFDRSDVRGDYVEVVAAHGRFLAENPGARVRLEGHADERGSREYNIGLGERRAQAVRQLLMLQGASDGQLSTVSFGEERPAAIGSDEETWALNRRVEIVYQ